MAHQDYVSRSRAKNKKQSPYRKNVEPAPAVSFKVKAIMLFLLIALPAFGYLLWTIKDKQPDVVVPPKTAKTVKAKSTELPKPPEEKWTYVDDLKKQRSRSG